jgi:hypothetical protein
MRNSEIKQLASFVSPTFFDVMPVRALWSHGKELRSKSRSPEAYRQAVARRQAALARAELGIELKAVSNSGIEGEAGETGGGERAERVVTLYFHQLFSDDDVLLDLRHQAFTTVEQRLIWRPAHWIVTFEQDFIEALRDIYRGFYSDDDALFRSGLERLHLTAAEELFREHFGENPSRVRFVVADFVSTFHQVFVRCRKAKVTLHPNFLELGIYLAALYEHLEELDVEVDVAACFQKASEALPGDVSHATG